MTPKDLRNIHTTRNVTTPQQSATKKHLFLYLQGGTSGLRKWSPSLEGWSTKTKEVPSPHEVRLAPLDTKLEELITLMGKRISEIVS